MCTSPNEEFGPLVNNAPLTGYAPNFFDDYHFSKTTEIFIQESSSDTRPSYLHDSEISDDTIGRALSSPLFTQEREEPAGRRQAYHSPAESLLSSQNSEDGCWCAGRGGPESFRVLQLFLFQVPCVLDDRFFNGMSRLRQVLKRPCGPPMGLAAGSTAAVAFEPRTTESRAVGAGADARARGQEVNGSHVCGSGSCRVEDPPLGSVSKEPGWARSAQRFSSGAREHFTGLQGGVYPGCEYTCARSILTLAQPREISTFKGRT